MKSGVFDHPGGPRGPKFLVVASLGLRNTWLIDGARFSLRFSRWCLWCLLSFLQWLAEKLEFLVVYDIK